MLRSTHMKITNEVLEELNVDLPSEIRSELLRGVVFPDDEKKRNGTRESHHFGRSREIGDHLVRARCCFVNGDLANSFFLLGVALHYIQDSYVTCRSTNGERHFEYERKMDDYYPNPDIEGSIRTYLSNQQYLMNGCLRMAQALKNDDIKGAKQTLSIARLNARDRPHDHEANGVIDYTLSYLATLTLVRAVILDPIKHPQLDYDLNKLHQDSEKGLNDIEIQLSNSLINKIGERNRLASSKNQSEGIVARIKNWMLKRKMSRLDQEIRSMNDHYFNRRHLQPLIWDYLMRAERIANLYDGWYAYKIKEIDISGIPQMIDRVQMANDVFGTVDIIKRQV
ncbi:MAG: hypothetical protein AB9860_02950 [Methanomassiliicoccales archaeon]